MTYATPHIIEITSDVTNIDILPAQMYVINALGAVTVTVQNHQLAPLDRASFCWLWQRSHTCWWAMLIVDWGEMVQYVNLNIIKDEKRQSDLSQVIAQLVAIDPRLCVGQSEWFRMMQQRDSFESRMGASCIQICHTLVRLIAQSTQNSVQEWRGGDDATLRFDRIGINTPTLQPIPMAEEPRIGVLLSRHEQMQLAAFMQFCALHYEVTADAIWHRLRQRLMQPVGWNQSLAYKITQISQALAQSRKLDTTGSTFHTADASVLYERWVWVTALCACGVTAPQITASIDAGATDAMSIDSDTWCGYQRRLLPQQHTSAWSRDGRVAIPDVIIWHRCGPDDECGFVIDAKYSTVHETPSAQACNDVTAYIRRIGIGVHDPIAALLVHPGVQSEVWPSGLVIVGTGGINSAPIEGAIHHWRQFII